MSWSRQQVSELIELYKARPCLYAVKNKSYRNKHARMSALTEIESTLQLIRPSTNIAEIKTKFNSLRTNFLGEYRKWKQSLKSGCGDDDIVEPSLWYFEDMMFILDHSMPRKSVDSLDDNNAVEEIVIQMQDENISEESLDILDFTTGLFTQGTSDDGCVAHQEELGSNQPGPSSKGHRPQENLPTTMEKRQICTSTPSRKRKREDREDNYMECASSALSKISTVLEMKESGNSQGSSEDIFGKLIAAKLKEIKDNKKKNLVQSDILQALFKSLND